jgi:hypothetical protein
MFNCVKALIQGISLNFGCVRAKLNRERPKKIQERTGLRRPFVSLGSAAAALASSLRSPGHLERRFPNFSVQLLEFPSQGPRLVTQSFPGLQCELDSLGIVAGRWQGAVYVVGS